MLLPSLLGSVGGMMGIGPKTTVTKDNDGNVISTSTTSRRQVEQTPANTRGGIRAGF
jgi:hypothetical protein